MEKNIWYYKFIVKDRAGVKKDLKGKDLKGIFDALQNDSFTKFDKNKNVYSIIIPKVKRSVKSNQISGNNVILDIYKNTNDYVFGTISNEKDHNTSQKRNNSNLQTTSILNNKEIKTIHFEVFSYFMIHYDTGIISFIQSMGGPAVSKFTDLVNILDKFTFAVPAIIRKDTVDIIYNSDYVKQLSFSTVTPSMEVLGVLGLSDDELHNLNESSIGDITITITAKRFQSFQDHKLARKVLAAFQSKKLKKAKVLCKSSENQEYLSHNLFSDKLCASVELSIDHTQNTENVRKEIEKKMIEAYNIKESDLQNSINK
ncbi:hypothetical protein Q5O14_16435 [Eubacteriaceae bacterium ES2]|nr:hypothetical protein Q5O14_16435 [Eubacteriaceae bacterium ES2]